MTNSVFNILLVEDNEADSELTMRIMKKEFHTPYQMTILTNGVEAWDYLQKQGKYLHSKLPNLIILDLNLPLVDGWEVLHKVKTHPDLKHIPVIILTTSKAQTDINKAYQEYSNSYIVKPLDIERFSSVIRGIENYWCKTVELPISE